MKTCKISIVLILLALISFLSISKTTNAETLPPAVQEKIHMFFTQLQNGQVQPAIQKIIEGGAIGKNPAQVENLIGQTNNAISLYGPVQGDVYVSSSTTADTLCKVIFLSKHTNYPLKWTFLFYKNADWTLVNIEFDDNIQELIQ